jgi:hypothetical protein
VRSTRTWVLQRRQGQRLRREEGDTTRSAHAQAAQCRNCELWRGTTYLCKRSSCKLRRSITLEVINQGKSSWRQGQRLSREEGDTTRSAHAQAAQCRNCELRRGTTYLCKRSSCKLRRSIKLEVEYKPREIELATGTTAKQRRGRHNQERTRSSRAV